METNLKFNSAVCTSRSQSERLLALGLKKETADMMYCKTASGELIAVKDDDYLEHLDTPTWSLSRLLSMMPSFIDIGGYEYMLRIIQGRVFSYRSDIAGYALLYGSGSVYDSAIYTIEWLIGEGCFNKEYLGE